MKTLRARLFFSVGIIFFIVAILSFYMPKFLVQSDIDHASRYLNQVVSSYHKKIQSVSHSWVTYRFLNMAAQLNAAVHFLKIEKKEIWQQAAEIIQSHPEIALVQVQEGQKVAVIYPESAPFQIPQWSIDQYDRLWIKTGDGKIYIAKTLGEKKENTYVLFDQKGVQMDPHLFSSFSSPPDFTLSSSEVKAVYEKLERSENLLLQKAELIEKLLPWRQTADGILKVTKDFKVGLMLLNQELFFSQPLIEMNQSTHPFIFYEKRGPYVDFVQWAPLDQSNQKSILLGYSISSICCEIAKTVQKPTLLYEKETLLQGFTAEGNHLPIDTLMRDRSQNRVEWQGVTYVSASSKIGSITVELLTPLSEVNQISYFLSQLRSSLVSKVSGNLLIVTLVVFGVALLLLARISKRFTEPIALLAKASEEIGEGKYEGLALPAVEKRHDEVAILNHSFQQMILSLRDREKIRGVLNKVVSKEIASRILSEKIELGGEERILTMLFNDIRSFTHLSETIPAQKLIALLNDHMTRMCRIIDATHGVVDKFVGDEVMALYGAPLGLENHADRALEAAFLMLEDLKKWNLSRASEPPITVGIGIHTGIAFAGNMGAENRLNYTVVGANVNLAARLCSAAKPMEILLSEQTYQALSNPLAFHLQKIAPITLKGIDEPTPVYTSLIT